MEPALTKGVKRPWLKGFSLLLRVSVAVLALWWVLRAQDWIQLKQIFAGLKPGPFLVTLAVFAVSQVMLATRWWMLLRAQAIHIPILMAIRLHYIGLFYNNLMPSSVGGDVLRAWYVSRHTDKRVEAALSVFVDRGLGLFGLLLMASFAYFVLLSDVPIASEGLLETEAGGIASFVCLAGWALSGSVVLLAVLLMISPTRRKLKCLLGSMINRFKSVSMKVKQALFLYCRTPGSLLLALGLTVVLQSLVISIFWYLGHHLGLTASAQTYFVVFPVSWVVATLPVSIAGIGVLESGLVASFVYLAQTTPEHAVALAFCQRIIWVINSLPGAAIHIAGAHMPDAISFDDPREDL